MSLFSKTKQRLKHSETQADNSITEGVCQLCNSDYPVWFAPNPLWNKVMRHPDGREASEKYHFVCPNCFIGEAEKLNVSPRVCWEVREWGDDA